MDRFRLVPSTLIFLIAVVLAATAAFGQAPTTEQKPLASGIVSEVNSFDRIIAINGGQILIDASQAQIRLSGSSDSQPFRIITPGAQIAVVFAPGSYGPGQRIPATVVQVLLFPIGTMTGRVEAVDVANSTLRILGQTIRVTEQTRFGSTVASLDARSLAELPVGRNVTVFFNGDQTALVAHEVFIIAPAPDEVIAFTGTVRQIRGNTWTLANSRFESFQVTSRTAINAVPPPRVGDLIHVLGRVDAGVVTAELITLARTQCPNFTPNPTISIRGYLIERTATSITVDNGTAVVRGLIDGNTLFDGGDAVVGDNVEMRVEKIGNNFVVKMLTRFDHPIVFAFLGVVRSKADGEWTIESSTGNTPDDLPYVVTRRVIINEQTNIQGNPAVGDNVVAAVDRAPDGTLTGKSIAKR
jgi:hypothetical protein